MQRGFFVSAAYKLKDRIYRYKRDNRDEHLFKVVRNITRKFKNDLSYGIKTAQGIGVVNGAVRSEKAA